MAYLLSGERPAVAASPDNPLLVVGRWFARARAAQGRRTALKALLELDVYRLDDLGISRQEVLDAMSQSGRPISALAARRATRANAWLGSH